MRDETQLMRVSTRLMELGVITPQQGMEMFHNGKFPNAEDIAPAQNEFIKQRKEGFYNPIVGGTPMIEEVESKDDSNKNATPNSAGRPVGTTTVQNEKLTRQNIQGTIYAVESFSNSAKEKAKEKFGSELTEQQEKMVLQLCESVVCSADRHKWNQILEACIENFDLIENLNVMDEILSVSNKHNLEVYPSAILYHSDDK